MADVVYRLCQHHLEPIHRDGEYLLIVVPVDIGDFIIIAEAMEVKDNFMGSTISKCTIPTLPISIYYPIQEWKGANKKRVTELVTLRDNFRTH